MKKGFLFVAFVLATLAGYTGSAFAWGGFGFGSEANRPSVKGDGQFAQGEALRNGTFYEGQVVFVRKTVLEGGSGESVGQLTGAALGGMLGAKVGKGNGRIAAAILGGVLGSSAGAAVGRTVAEDRATEVFVKLDDGRKVSVVQIMDQEIRPGDKVIVAQSATGNYRVVSTAQGY